MHLSSAVSNAALPAKTVTDLQSYEDIDKEMYQSFADGKIKQEVSISSTMKKSWENVPDAMKKH